MPGQRNQFYPINTLSGFSYGGVPRRFSPLNIDARYRPTQHTFVDFRTDLDTRGGGLRAMSTTFGFNRAAIIQAFSEFLLHARDRAGAVARAVCECAGAEPGTLRGSQWSPSVFLGNRERGLFGGLSFFFDFQKRPGRGDRSLISSTVTLGYTWDCCAVTAQYYTFNVGLRKENRLVFSFPPQRHRHFRHRADWPGIQINPVNRRGFSRIRSVEDLDRGSLAVTRPNHYNVAL